MDDHNPSQWAISAGNKFRQVARETENLTTKLLAEGLAQLAEAIRAHPAALVAGCPARRWQTPGEPPKLRDFASKCCLGAALSARARYARQ